MISTSYDVISYDIRKFAENKQTNRQTNRQTENSKPEATLIPVERRGERANSITEATLIPVDHRGERANI